MSSPTPDAPSITRRLLATTPTGRWCLTAFGVGVLGFVAMVLSVASGQEGGDTFADNWWISGPTFVAGIALVAAFATGLFAIIGRRERGLAVFVATLIGALVTLFIVGEVTTPH